MAKEFTYTIKEIGHFLAHIPLEVSIILGYLHQVHEPIKSDQVLTMGLLMLERVIILISICHGLRGDSQQLIDKSTFLIVVLEFLF